MSSGLFALLPPIVRRLLHVWSNLFLHGKEGDIYDSKFPLPPPGSLFGAGCCVGGRPGKPFSAPAN